MVEDTQSVKELIAQLNIIIGLIEGTDMCSSEESYILANGVLAASKHFQKHHNEYYALQLRLLAQLGRIIYGSVSLYNALHILKSLHFGLKQGLERYKQRTSEEDCPLATMFQRPNYYTDQQGWFLKQWDLVMLPHGLDFFHEYETS